MFKQFTSLTTIYLSPGQHPCVLSCIVANSPADRVGLHAGDYLMSVNGLDVSKHSHDDVVCMVGSSTGTLTIQVRPPDVMTLTPAR